MASITAYIVRHGQTVFNVERITQGHSDSPLTQEGIKQAQLLGERLRDVNFDAVFSSDSLRAQRTAEFIISARNIPIISTELLRERKYGRFDGKPSVLFGEVYKNKMEEEKTLTREDRWKLNVEADIESDDEVWGRFEEFIKKANISNAGQTLLVVTHAGVLRTLLNYLRWGGVEDVARGAVQNTAYVKLVSDGKNFTILHVDGVTI